MRTTLLITMSIICLDINCQGFNPAEWEKANRAQNTLTLMQYGGVAVSFYGLGECDAGIILSGFVFVLGMELLKMDIEKHSLRLYYEPNHIGASISVPINGKRLRKAKKGFKLKHKL